MTQIVTLPPERCSPFTSAPHCTTNKALHKDSLSVAVEYLRLGWRVLPLEPRGKKPLHGMGWKNIRLTEDELAAYWNETPCANLAVVCGGGLVVVDLDGPRAQRWWIKTFGFSLKPHGRARGGRAGRTCTSADGQKRKRGNQPKASRFERMARMWRPPFLFTRTALRTVGS